MLASPYEKALKGSGHYLKLRREDVSRDGTFQELSIFSQMVEEADVLVSFRFKGLCCTFVKQAPGYEWHYF